MSNSYFKKKKWTEEQEAWLIEHKDICGKVLMYNEFKKAFPDAQFTVSAISSKRTEIGAYGKHNIWKHKNGSPLYAERVKKGYVQIKVSSFEWWSKAKWVWVATHPGEPFDIRNQFLFLDGNNRNFAPDNIMKVNHAEMGILNRNYGGFKSKDAAVNRSVILLIRHKLAMLGVAEKAGLTCNYGVGRMFIDERNRKARERNANLTEEQRKRRAEYARQRYHKKKLDAEWIAKQREYQRKWQKKKRNSL